MHEAISTWHKTRKVRGERIKTAAEFMEILHSSEPGSVIVARHYPLVSGDCIHPAVFVGNWAFRTVCELIRAGMLYKTTTRVVRSTQDKGGEHDPLQ